MCMDNRQKQEPQTPIEKLLDQNNADPIVLYNEEDEAVVFEQIAVIPYHGATYAILRPIAHMDGVADDEALTFVISEAQQALIIVEEDFIVDAVFEKYYALLDAANQDKN